MAVVKRERDLIASLYEQLPEQIQGKFDIDVRGDAFRLRTIATFIGPNGIAWTCTLEGDDRIPDTFKAHLTLAV